MAIKFSKLVWNHATEVRGEELVVLLALAEWANDQGRSWYSQPKIAAHTRIPEHSLRRFLDRLVDRGYLAITPGGGRGKTALYTLNEEALLASPPICEKGTPRPLLEKRTQGPLLEEKRTLDTRKEDSGATERGTPTTLKEDSTMRKSRLTVKNPHLEPTKNGRGNPRLRPVSPYWKIPQGLPPRIEADLKAEYESRPVVITPCAFPKCTNPAAPNPSARYCKQHGTAHSGYIIMASQKNEP